MNCDITEICLYFEETVKLYNQSKCSGGKKKCSFALDMLYDDMLDFRYGSL